MGLTTQGLALATRTSIQLKEQKIDLKTASPFAEDVYFLNDHHGVLYRNGILFTSGSHKGKALFTFCEKIGLSPQKIVFINDKTTHLSEIEIEAEKRGVEFIGLRYSYSDAKKAKFSPELAHIQFTHSSFDKILSDEEAAQLCKAALQPVQN